MPSPMIGQAFVVPRDAWKRAGDILRELGHPDADLLRARLG